MRPITKTGITQAQANTIVRLHCNQTLQGFTELSDGAFNAAYRLDLANGTTRVLKIAPPPDVPVMSYEKDILKAEVGALRLVRRKTRMPVPQIHAHDESGSLIPSAYFLMDFVPGRSVWDLRQHLSEDAVRQIDQAAGRYQKEMNAIQGESFGYFASSQRFSDWRDCFDHILRGVLKDGRAVNVPLPLEDAALITLAQRHYPALENITSPQLVHWDLWDGNIFVDPETFQITGIIDFERALWGDPLMEVGFGGLMDKPYFIEGYGEDLRNKPGAAARKALYNLYLYLIMVIEPTYRQYATDDQENWAREKLASAIETLESLA
jgi:aminoglycoside phosphotransferase (APT) family kinase protein